MLPTREGSPSAVTPDLAHRLRDDVQRRRMSGIHGHAWFECAS
jgi:hypothetical protein